jgi:hypothetical protein
VQFDPEGAARLSRADSYYTTTSSGLARARSIAGESTYSTIAYDVCFDTEVSASTEPRSVRSVTPMPAPSTPYHSAPEPPTSPQSMSSIPTVRAEESQYATPDRVNSSMKYSPYGGPALRNTPQYLWRHLYPNLYHCRLCHRLALPVLMYRHHLYLRPS